MVILETERLSLRTWEAAHAEPFLKINQDPQVLEYLDLFIPKNLEETHAVIDRQNRQQARKGYAFWATQLKKTGELIGFVGLDAARERLPCAPAVKIGWRLGSAYWGKGYATEAARAALAYGLKELKLEEIVAIVVPDNKRSIRVIERLGMQRDASRDFMHPYSPPGHPLAWHILYTTSHQNKS